jgi:hypothetical protein
MAGRTVSYGEAYEKARAGLAAARLGDPDEHFPYKHDAVIDLMDSDPPMGPGVPDGVDGTEDTSRAVADYTSQGIADASGAYIEAQAAYLRDPGEDTRAGYEAARDALVAARLDHRINRGNGFTVGAAARRAG